jgi:ABC-type Fe3+/spermidine/putrescine transport system ATPase subunit
MSEINIRLKKQFSEFKLDMEFVAKEGQLISIIGPSGCGKSTTLGLITGLLPLDEGEVRIGDVDLTSLPVNQREIAMVFQDYTLYPHLKVKDNIAYPLKIRKVKKTERYKEATRLLSLVGLEGFEERKVESLSGGECQRIALARALASKPKILLLDEPLSALDAKLRGYLRDEIKRIHDETGITMIYVTHDQEEALSISDKIIILNKGKIEMIGTGEEIYNHPESLFSATFMGEGNLLDISNFSNIPPSFTGPLFFRPEDANIIENENLPIPELLPYTLIKDVVIERIEFRGAHYIIKAKKGNNSLLISTTFKPVNRVVSIFIQLRNLREFSS